LETRGFLTFASAHSLPPPRPNLTDIISMNKQRQHKKILYVITKGNWGGAQRYVYDLATNLDRKEFEAAVLYGEGEALKEKLLKARIKSVRLESLGRDIKIGNDIKVFFDLLKIFRSEEPDIIHLNSSKIGAIGALAGRIARVPHIIFTAHGWPFKEDRNLFAKLVIKFISWLTVIFSHTTIVVSEDDFEKSKKFPFTKGKIFTIHNGVGNLAFKDGFQARQFLGNGIEQNTWIGSMAELHPNKGLDRLIKGFADLATQYKDSALVLIGSGQEEKSLKNLAHALGVEKQVYFLGHIDNASQYLKAFDVFALTSRKEGLPYALLEAGRAELPVIASHIGGIPEIVEHERTGLLIRTEKDIYTSLHRFLSRPDERKEFGKELKRTIQTEFTADQCREKTFALYGKTISLYTKLEVERTSQEAERNP